MSGSGPRCEICLRQVETDAAVRICPGCQQTYHLDCWEKRGACVHPDCQLRWWNLFTAGRRFWRRTLAYYRQAWTLHHAPIPPHIWAMLLGVPVLPASPRR